MYQYLVTGSAGFIGHALCHRLLKSGYFVVGLDNHNDYYDPALKEDRLKNLLNYKNYTHYKEDLCNLSALRGIFQRHQPHIVVNLAAQAGVRFSIENPHTYISSNVVGFTNLIELSANNKVKHFFYASSSSVYGGNKKIPFSILDTTDDPISLYAATKKSNELIANVYKNIHGLKSTGLRFFTVYGPWGRPDMALFKFTKAILNGERISVYNNGNHTRDFTYIDDVIESVTRMIELTSNSDSNFLENIYNIGNGRPATLMSYIKSIESSLGIPAKIEYLPIQPGDVADTYAEISETMRDCKYSPQTSIDIGVKKFTEWYVSYYKNN